MLVIHCSAYCKTLPGAISCVSTWNQHCCIKTHSSGVVVYIRIADGKKKKKGFPGQSDLEIYGRIFVCFQKRIPYCYDIHDTPHQRLVPSKMLFSNTVLNME